MSYTLVNNDDPSIESFRGAFFKIRRALGTTAFGINEIRLPAGVEGIEHDETETGHEEVYIVLSGRGTFTIDGEAVEVGEGDYLRIDADSRRIVVAGADGITFVAVAAQPKPEYDGRPSL
jgi:quercetin dioxygenase-like cupin family protein